MNDILERIFAAKARVQRQDQERESFDIVRARALARRSDRRSFAAALQNTQGPAIIGEIKRASPSVGLIARNFEPAVIAAAYDRAGIDAISVLTESDHFLGELKYLDLVRSQTTRPLLRKDFLRTQYEVAQSAAYGADAILLIVAGLSDEELTLNMDVAKLFALDVLVEVHNEAELTRALNAGATLLGINNRDLRTFETDLSVSERLIPLVPAGVTIVSESGVRGADDIARLHAAGAHGFLVGETLMRSDDPVALVRQLKAAAAGSSLS
ncbi:MAG: indole-3-glycerol phosphate synthase TrpC [Candidatus Eremiobacteraeota bacterium]|nr:indole-3-glycerol phosphate synthase TrpC [Candidatus Eremiobacteraeota bacterium]